MGNSTEIERVSPKENHQVAGGLSLVILLFFLSLFLFSISITEFF